MKTESTTIRIDQEIKDRIDDTKGNLTYNKFIEELLDQYTKGE